MEESRAEEKKWKKKSCEYNVHNLMFVESYMESYICGVWWQGNKVITFYWSCPSKKLLHQNITTAFRLKNACSLALRLVCLTQIPQINLDCTARVTNYTSCPVYLLCHSWAELLLKARSEPAHPVPQQPASGQNCPLRFADQTLRFHYILALHCTTKKINHLSGLKVIRLVCCMNTRLTPGLPEM